MNPVHPSLILMLFLVVNGVPVHADPGSPWVGGDHKIDIDLGYALPEDLIERVNIASENEDWGREEDSGDPGKVRKWGRIEQEVLAAPRHRRARPPLREIYFEAANPAISREANTRAWYSLNQVLCLGNDLLGVEAGIDRFLPGRLFLLASAAFLSGGLSYYSHEMGHTFEEVRKGAEVGFNLDGSRWVTLGYPEYLKNFAPKDTQWTREEDCRAIVGGLNQTSRNAWFAWERAMVRGAWDFNTGLSFLEGKLDHLLQLYVGCQDRESENDANGYIDNLEEGGIDLDRRGYLAHALLADLLSWPVMESLLAVGTYAVEGDRKCGVHSIPVYRGLSVSPPLIRLALTPRGGFYEVGLFLLAGKLPPLEIKVGRRADFFGESKVRGARVGARVHGLNLVELNGFRALISPFLFLTVTEAPRGRGFLMGTEIELGFQPLSLTARIEFAHGDVIDRAVYGEESRFTAVFGLLIRY